ncbi:hypothetical protein [Streptomyces paromomycinus]|uniref:Uncharacterized protein n=1 Tax=Streptomyces paromomycinus TaxID=92743 RepID=A0A401WAL8_STREY|nr:hypothetical protein [Streptomyces paromomycinus]GCD46406.1 hypothetical protein GKJPGBOP_06155 [Streptomyces paromomycinus]
MTGERCGASLRLLPWTTPEGKACYLSTDDAESLLSLLADEAEEEVLKAAEELVAADAGPRRLLGALRDVLRVAVSRGARLVQAEAQPCEHGVTERCEGKTYCGGCRRQIYL